MLTTPCAAPRARSGRWSVPVVFILLVFVAPASLHAQAVQVSGRVTNQLDEPLSGVRVLEQGTLNSTTTDQDGRYEMAIGGTGAVIVFAAAGYRDEERRPGGAATVDVTMATIFATAVEVVGSRRVDRSASDTPVPVDVIDMQELMVRSGPFGVNQLLQVAAPSFNATRQSGADGADHIDPATLRGLGPDQTLVLVNGKRRHQSSLVNIFGTRGRGNTGTDLNAIPAFAIDRIEILRDGASAQYGSDAIAGVINVVLKSGTDGFTGLVGGGAHDASPPARFDVLSNGALDGAGAQAALNYGVGLRNDGFLNMTGQVETRQRTNRPADPAVFSVYRRQYGDAEASDASFFTNLQVPLSPQSAFYLFGGASHRRTGAFAWTRDADSDRNVPALYPNGFDPRITSRIGDVSVSAGARRRARGWDLDLHNTFGLNRFHYHVDGSLNASLGEASPTRFDAGGFQLVQNTTGLRASRPFDGVASGLHLAVGAEHRLDNYRIFAGEDASWQTYTPGRPGGAQGFPGFRPANALSRSRSNIGAFADVEIDVTRRVLVGGAARFETYSDFGNALTTKVTGRVDVARGLVLRASASTGFRAPSLAQVHFNSTFTDVVSGNIIDKVIAASDSGLTRAVGIPPLEEERATNVSAGLVARAGPHSATVDVYRVAVDRRIVLTGAFDDTDPLIGPQLQSLGVAAAQFFTNALDTRTVGVDVVFETAQLVRSHVLRWTLAGNFNDMALGAVRTTPALSGREDTYFGERERAFLEASSPPVKITGGLDHDAGRLQTSVRLAHYGRVRLIDFLGTPDVYRPARTVDLAVTYRITPRLLLTAGAANALNNYPTQQDTETESGGVWDAVQMGFAGALYFTRLQFKF